MVYTHDVETDVLMNMGRRFEMTAIILENSWLLWIHMKQTEGWVLFYRHISNTLVGLVANSTFNMKVALITIILASLALYNEVGAEPEPQGKEV